MGLWYKTTHNVMTYSHGGKRFSSPICDLSRAQQQKRVSAPVPPARPDPPHRRGSRVPSREGTRAWQQCPRGQAVDPPVSVDQIVAQTPEGET